MPFEANLRVHDRAPGPPNARQSTVRIIRRRLSGVKVKSRPYNQSFYSRFFCFGLAHFATINNRRYKMKCEIHINVVINAVKSINLGQRHAPKVEKQVDSDQGRKLSLRAYLPLVISMIPKVIEYISDKVNW